MRMELEVCSELRASHSLVGNELPHVHIWKISVCFSAPFPLKEDRVLDLVMLQKVLNSILGPYQNTFLNESIKFSPTSENIAAFIYQEMKTKLSATPIKSVQIALCSLNGECTGKAKLINES